MEIKSVIDLAKTETGLSSG